MGTAVALPVSVVVVAVGGVITFGMVDPLVNSDTKTITSAWLSAGAMPSQVSAPESAHRAYTSKALAYRLSAGKSVVSIFTLPHLKKTWAERFFHTGPKYVFDGGIDFQPDRTCASEARLTWRLHDKSGRFPLTHEVGFYKLNVPADTITLTARLDALGPCTGVLRLIDPEVTNGFVSGPGSGASLYTAKSPPEVETSHK
ncbi:hypothetical protein E1264_00295 [Actinomadura sp. KC216]|uniref:hypothetical protein n=1 Tax=Actinomadura sp. KC216 TaxID=2530370 RepID=UPI001046C83F|nr:hypothetical protein [Actinomadura sp. KC216]TDB91943.1 hypothetical protein E1264_00295 [Actinomadura sp. KC216]